MKEILIATHNEHKKEEIQQILGNEFKVTSLTDYDIHDEIVEDGSTFHENLESQLGLRELDEKQKILGENKLEPKSNNNTV